MRSPDDTLISERLMLRRFTLDDLDLLEQLHSDPEVMRYVGGVMDRAKSEAMLRERILAYYDHHPGLGVWATLERATGECVGMHLINHIKGEPDIQLGYLLFARHWGRGYATEMSVRLLHYGFGELGLAQIVGITDLDNVASQQVLLKAGLRRNGTRNLPHPAYAAGPLAWFERDRDGWLAEHQATSPFNK